ncbi:MAG: hypothetical protein ACMXYC_02710 [Candidatus Woesearchaeota archaeon]
MHKKAQTATEYLIILAVVIIIALILVAVLGGIPSIGGGTADSVTQLSWQTNNEVAIPSLAINTQGNVSMTLKNNRANNIRVQNIYMNGSIGDRDSGSSVYTTPIVINGGQTSRVVHAQLGSDICVESGVDIALYIMIEYEDLNTGAVFNFSNGNEAYQTICAAG